MIYRSKIIRLKCSLNRSYINYGELNCDSFLKIVWVVWLERVVPNSFWTSLPAFRSLNCFIIATLWSNRVLHAHREADVNQTCQQSVFSPIGACIRIWCTARGCRGTAVANIGLQAFTLFPLPSSRLDKRPVHRLYFFDLIISPANLSYGNAEHPSVIIHVECIRIRIQLTQFPSLNH